ncbi:MAG: ABC transporter permease, partial [Gemmiger sp.]
MDEKKPQTVSEQDAQSQLGEKEGLLEQLRRMCRQNKLAAFSAVVILVIILLAVFAPVVAPYGEAEQDLLRRLNPPSAEHWFGTDELGRDVFSRILYGARLSLMIGIVPTIISLVVGVILGLIAGYFGGWADYLIMRIADVMLSFPSLLLAMVIMYTLGSSTINIFIALSLVNWASVARVVRSHTLSLKET